MLVCELCNDSKDTILVKLEYDTVSVNGMNPAPVIIMVFSHPNTNIIVVRTDTVALTKEILITPPFENFDSRGCYSGSLHGLFGFEDLS